MKFTLRTELLKANKNFVKVLILIYVFYKMSHEKVYTFLALILVRSFTDHFEIWRIQTLIYGTQGIQWKLKLSYVYRKEITAEIIKVVTINKLLYSTSFVSFENYKFNLTKQNISKDLRNKCKYYYKKLFKLKPIYSDILM